MQSTLASIGSVSSKEGYYVHSFSHLLLWLTLGTILSQDLASPPLWWWHKMLHYNIDSFFNLQHLQQDLNANGTWIATSICSLMKLSAPILVYSPSYNCPKVYHLHLQLLFHLYLWPSQRPRHDPDQQIVLSQAPSTINTKTYRSLGIYWIAQQRHALLSDRAINVTLYLWNVIRLGPRMFMAT